MATEDFKEEDNSIHIKNLGKTEEKEPIGIEETDGLDLTPDKILMMKERALGIDDEETPDKKMAA